MTIDTPTPTPNSSSSPSKHKNPHVLIVGAGVAGLFLAILLERAGIPYQVYERAKEVKPLGAVMSLNAGILPAFEQLGLYEELEKVSLRADSTFNILYGDLSVAARIVTRVRHEIGYNIAIFARTDLYDLLLSKIPSEKIKFNKKIIRVEQDEKEVRITCSDGTSYNGDVLVGADGAYSSVRQELYKEMQEKNILPVVDTQEMDKGYICMVGTTTPLDPAEYPGVDDEVANINQIIGMNSNYCWSAFSVPGNRICWNVILQLSTVQEANENKFKNAEWSGDSSDPMIKEVRNFLIPFGNKTLGDLIDATPQDNISKVFLEDKLFETWNHGRTVLIGDACHKLLPSAGLGAVTSMQDAVVLANCLYEMKGLSPDDIKETLSAFKEERYSRVKGQCEASRMNAKLLYGQSMMDRFLRTVVFNWLPESFRLRGNMKGLEFRPQATFLPQIPVRGIGYVIPQMVSQRYKEEQAYLHTASPSLTTTDTPAAAV
ncbi:FAD/NAD(P)-binding domain-containing protein [Linnemannia elongata AG-77]|uniref:FAD/NAD(P)-binding domain-containing protein n=1 Tax=Linnemannia elongata AG-77 TaxID=1314771 RepID=A0A197JSV7_9FUNG|nr:FAD/NAD(P)-binding domain-containing protein [Linnemannia elongata AG-77]